MTWTPMFRTLRLASLLVLGSLAVSACNDDSTVDPRPEITVETADYGTLDIEGAITVDIGENEFAAPNSSAPLATCISSRTRTTTGNVRTLRITFNGQPCADDRTRTGSILVTWQPGPDSLTVQRTIRTDNYFVNGNRLRINATINYNLVNLTKTIVASDTVEYSAGGTARWTTNRTWQWTAGATTPTVFTDDEFTLTGTATLVSRENINTQITIATGNPLVWKRRCTNNRGEFVRGEVTIAPAGRTNSVINYGSGQCDGLARLTVGNLSGDITIR